MAYYTYAEAADVLAYLDVEALPALVTTRLIARANELIKRATRENIDILNADHLEAAKQASCAQIEFWLEMQESFAIQPDVNGFSSGDVRVDFAKIPEQLAKRARGYLNEWGLLFMGARSSGCCSCCSNSCDC